MEYYCTLTVDSTITNSYYGDPLAVSVIGASAGISSLTLPVDGYDEIEFDLSPCRSFFSQASNKIVKMELVNFDERLPLYYPSGATAYTAAGSRDNAVLYTSGNGVPNYAMLSQLYPAFVEIKANTSNVNNCYKKISVQNTSTVSDDTYRQLGSIKIVDNSTTAGGGSIYTPTNNANFSLKELFADFKSLGCTYFAPNQIPNSVKIRLTNMYGNLRHNQYYTLFTNITGTSALYYANNFRFFPYTITLKFTVTNLDL